MPTSLVHHTHVPSTLLHNGGAFIAAGERGAIEHTPQMTLLHVPSRDRNLELCEWLEKPCEPGWLDAAQHAKVRRVLTTRGENGLWDHLDQLYIQVFCSNRRLAIPAIIPAA